MQCVALAKLKPENTQRLRLYASTACPFSHRALAALSLTGLGQHMEITWMNVLKRESGWAIQGGADPVFSRSSLRGVYDDLALEADCRASVPLLLDAHVPAFLSNESSAITRFISRGFNGRFCPPIDLCPASEEAGIDRLNDWLHQNICRAVYRVGFATEQSLYDKEVRALFAALDQVENTVLKQPFLIGNALTEPDLYLFSTLVRFDRVYGPLFKCSIRSIASYPALSDYLARLLNIPDLAQDVFLTETVEHYYGSLIQTKQGVRDLNPSRIIPALPDQAYAGSLHKITECL